tara:strand:+ start:3059 stop:5335 length:2277 start_codon:yes stop_codon:yes gene_type:complete
MARIRVPLSNFQFGEVSPSMVSRTDTKIYQNAAKKIENFFLRNEGGLLKRFGTRRIYEFDTTVDTTKRQQVRIIPFIFSDDERYIISLEHLKIRCFKIDPTTGAVSIVTTITQDVDSAALPITDSILDEITFAQSGDIMFLCHQTFMIRRLVRTGLNSFEMDTYSFASDSDNNYIHQPYYSFHGEDVTLDPSTTSGSGVTLTTSANYWDITGTQSGGDYPSSKHIGIVIRYHGQEITITSVQSQTQATGTVKDALKVHLDTDAIETTDGTADIQITMALHGLSTNDSITISDAGGIGGISAGNINGTRTVQEIVNENVFIVTAGANANTNSIGGGSPKIETHAPTTQWEEQSYSALRGFPAAVAFHENRLWFGGTLSQPDGIWASRTGLYFNFDVGDAEDDDALDLTASIGEINTIRHIVSNRDLQIFTSTSELYVPAFTDKPITPTNAQIRRQTPFGASFVRPQSLDGATLYVQKNGSVVREFIFSDAESAYVANPISQISAHLINNPVQMSILRGAINRPESYAFFLNQDGTIAIFTSNRGEQRAGWAKFTTSNGKFHSIATVDDRVFLVGVYDIGNNTNKFILTEFDSSLQLDFSNTFVQGFAPAGVFNVAPHFANGAVVDVVNGDDHLGQFTVVSGQVDVTAVEEITTAEIGYSFNVEAETLPIDAQVQGGPLTGNPRRVNRVILDLVNTLSVSVNDKRLIIRQVTDDLGAGRIAVTGKEEFRLLGYSKDPTVKITQSAPLSLQINGLIAEVSF